MMYSKPDEGLLDAIRNVAEGNAASKWNYVYTSGDGDKEKQGPFDSKEEAHQARLAHLKDWQVDHEDLTKNSHELWTDTTGESWALRKHKEPKE